MADDIRVIRLVGASFGNSDEALERRIALARRTRPYRHGSASTCLQCGAGTYGDGDCLCAACGACYVCSNEQFRESTHCRTCHQHTHSACESCGKCMVWGPFTESSHRAVPRKRSDGRYCSNACRQRAYRRRLRGLVRRVRDATGEHLVAVP